MSKNWLALSLVFGALTLSGCDIDPSDWGSSDRYKEDFSYQHKLNSGGRVVLETFNGSVEVMGWDGTTVDISGAKYASREEVMRDMKIDIISDPGSLRIRAVRPMEHNCNCGARFVLKVPKNVILDTITSSNGSLRVESIQGSARLKTSNASIRVWNLEGPLEATTSNASVELDKFKGAATIVTSNGRIKADGVEGAFSAHTSNSSIDARIVSMEAGRSIEMESSNGSINATLESWNNNAVRATTSNSSINLQVPENIHADLRASTSNGSITSDLPITTNQFGKTRVAGQLNGGGPLLDLSSSNGNIRLLKKH